MTTPTSQSINSHRDKKYRNKLRTHAGAYRRKIRVNEEAISSTYKETQSIELGVYRHNAAMCNYDYIVNKALTKWMPRDEKLALEIIHSIQNRTNALILECILKADREIR